MSRFGIAVVATSLILLTGPATASDPVPEEDGFSGFINPGLAYTTVKSNTLAGDLGTKRIDSLTARPGSQSSTGFRMPFNVAYTFAEPKIQVFAGTRLLDLLRFDFATQLGVKKQFENGSALTVGYLFSAFPGKLWQDPFVVDQKRKSTDRDSYGVRVRYDRILGSNFEAEVSYRKIDVDKESSGEWLGLSESQRKQLRRKGDQTRVELAYQYGIGEGRHAFVPAINYVDYDLDGDAMASKEIGLQLTHLYFGDRWRFVTNLFGARNNYDARHPVYARTRDETVYGASFQAFYSEPFGVKNLSVAGQLSGFMGDSNIDFYDVQASVLGASVLYRF